MQHENLALDRRADVGGQRKSADIPLEQQHVLVSLSGDHSVVTVVMKIHLEEGVSARQTSQELRNSDTQPLLVTLT